MKFYNISFFAILTFCAYSTFAEDFKDYQGNIGGDDVTFLLAWEESGKVKGKCSLANGFTLPIEGNNYAEGKLRLVLGEVGNPTGIIELSKANENGFIVWSGICEFTDGSRRIGVLMRRNSSIKQHIDTLDDNISEKKTSHLKSLFHKYFNFQPDVNLSFEEALQTESTINQNDELKIASYSNYTGKIGESKVSCDFFFGENDVVLGNISIENESGLFVAPPVRGGRELNELTLIGTNSKPGEIIFQVFYKGKKLGAMFLEKETESSIIAWKGICETEQGRDSVMLTRENYSSDLDRFMDFTGDMKKVGNYALWQGNSNVPFNLLEPIGEINLKNTGNPNNPIISYKENLPSDISSGLIADKNKLIVVSHGSIVTAFDFVTGGKVWSANFPFSVSELHLSCDGDYIFILGGYGNEAISTDCIWQLPISGNGKCTELFRTWGQGSEGALPVLGRIVSRIPKSDQFLIKLEDARIGELKPKKACFPTRMIFDAKRKKLYSAKITGEILSFVNGVNLQSSASKEIAGCTVGNKIFSLVNNKKTIDFVQKLDGKNKILKQWNISGHQSRINSFEIPKYFFWNNKLYYLLGFSKQVVIQNSAYYKPSHARIIPLDLKDPGNFIFKPFKAKNDPDTGAEILYRHGISESDFYKIDAYGAEFGFRLVIFDKKTNRVIYDESNPKGVLPLNYGDLVLGDWLDQKTALLGLPNGQFLIVSCDKSEPVSILNSGSLPASAGLFSLEQSFLSLSSDLLYKNKLYLHSGTIDWEYFVTLEKGIPSSVIFRDNIYSGFIHSLKNISAVANSRALPFEQFDLRLNRPDIVLERLGAPDEAIVIAKQLRKKRLKRMGVTEEMLRPDFHLPEIDIVGDLPSSTAESEIALTVKAFDSKYPLDRLRIYVNNVPVNGKEGELLRDAKSQSLERTIPIKLAAGRNKIQVSVLNSAGAESLYANAEVTCSAQRPKPTLYAVAMGVSDYFNPEWNLKYAAKDASDILARIRSKSGSSYGEVKELLLTDREVTKENLSKVREFLSKVTVDDTVLMFVAGHGLLDSKYDYYFGTSDIDFENPSGKGIAFEEFDDLLAELPCLKKSLLIDTCHAGELDEDEKKALAAAQSAPTGQQVAMHPVGARGMSVKPIEGARGKSEWYDRLQGLFVDLRRGSGSTILSSSAGAEYALESSEQKNGLFTYAVLEALDGKEGADANKDGSVTMSELAEYVKSRVATLTNNKQSPNVRRVNLEADFALAKKNTP
jgi:hypothetical protein